MKIFRKYKKEFAALALIAMINQLVLPSVALANNGGDISTEYSKGGGVGSDLVNLYNGAFNYKIDLLTLTGDGVSFPISISYNSKDVSMLSVPTSVGEGWSLNIPKINRTVSAIPDDFNGKKIEYTYGMKPSREFSFNLTPREIIESISVIGNKKSFIDKSDELDYNLVSKQLSKFKYQVILDNYNGVRFRVSAKNTKKWKAENSKLLYNLGVSEASASPSLVYDTKYGFSLGLDYDFDLDIQNKNWGVLVKDNRGNGGIGLSGSVQKDFSGLKLGMGKYLNFSWENSGVPLISLPTSTITTDLSIKLGLKELKGDLAMESFAADVRYRFPRGLLEGTLTTTSINGTNLFKDRSVFLKEAYGLMYEKKSNADDNGVKYFNKGDESIKDFIRHGQSMDKQNPFLPTSKVGNDIFVQSGGYGGVFTVNNENVYAWSETQAQTSNTIVSLGTDFGFNKPDVIPDTTDDSTDPEAVPKLDFHIGLGFGVQGGITRSGKWDTKGVIPRMSDMPYERAELKASEVHVDDNKNGYYTWGEDKPMVVYIDKEGVPSTPDRTFRIKKRFFDVPNNSISMGEDDTTSHVNTNDDDYAKNVDSRKLKYVQYFTTKEARTHGFTKNSDYIEYIKDNDVWKDARLDDIAEISVYERDGSHLIYGTPVYNHQKIDVNFSLNTRDKQTSSQNNDDNLGLNEYYLNDSVDYHGEDFNKVGKEMYTRVKTPEYATSWLIEKIPSVNYVDVNNDGLPSREDNGDCVQFKYYTQENEFPNADSKQYYNWRYPYKGVDVMGGIKDCPRDNMATYSFGQNEIKYPRTIETKTHLVEFIYDRDRKDGYPVKSEIAGGINVNAEDYQKTWRLKELRLYKKSEIDGSIIHEDNYIQRVVLEHDYSLCKKHPSNIESLPNGNYDESGKLTLRKVYSTYRQSKRGEAYAYDLIYDLSPSIELKPKYESTEDFNPDYDRHNIDRWGDFVDNKGMYGENSKFPYKDLPYTDQYDKSNYGSAPWHLRLIKLPSGADLKIDYEKNTYGYVENKQATQMYNVIAHCSDSSFSNTTFSSLEDYQDLDTLNHVELDENTKIWVELDSDVFSSVSDKDLVFYNKYIKGIDNNVFSKMYVHLKDQMSFKDVGNSLERNWDWVDFVGSTEEDDIAVQEKTDSYGVKHYYGGIKLKSKIYEAWISSISPIRMAGFEKIKNVRDDMLFGQPSGLINESILTNILNSTSTNVFKNISKLLGSASALKTTGAVNAIRTNGWSVIRLKNPNKQKKGGGYRVSHVRLFDNWRNNQNSTTVDDEYEYILKYDYSNYDSNGNNIGSSGVAIEPASGREENANWDLITYKTRDIFGIEESYKNVYGHPLDVFQGGPGVQYGNVIVTTEFPDNVKGSYDLDLSTPPFQEYKFYTAKEFPFIKKRTRKTDVNPVNFSISIPGWVNTSYTSNAVSQGYSVVTNDMPGKLRSLKTFDRNHNIINGQIYHYQESVSSTDDVHQKSDDLETWIGEKKERTVSNNVVLLGGNKKVKNGILGISQKVWLDTHESWRNFAGISPIEFDFGFSVKGSYIFNYLQASGLRPIVHKDNKTNFVVTMKQIHKSGLLDSVETIKDESKIITKYHMYDEKTGKVILSEVQNEYGDPIYKYSHSAYHEYEKFNEVENSIDVHIKDVVFVNGLINTAVTDINGLADGDHVVYSLNGGMEMGVLTKEANSFRIIPEDSDIPLNVNNVLDLRVVKSGYTNFVDASVGEIVSQEIKFENDAQQSSLNLQELLQSGSLATTIEDGYDQLKFDKLLNVSAVTFKDEWPLGCCNPVINPYLNGEKNFWRPYQSFVYHGYRSYGVQHKTRDAGRLRDYVAFDWTPGVYPQKPSPWVLTSEAILFDKNGKLLQQRDGLGISSATGFGYGGALSTFVVGNSQHNESGFDSFEDYLFYKCDNMNNEFTFYPLDQPSMISREQSHSGKSSLKLEPYQSVKKDIPLKECKD